MISGFSVDSFQNGMGTNPAFGVGILSVSPQSTTLQVDIAVYGRVLLTSIDSYYISY